MATSTPSGATHPPAQLFTRKNIHDLEFPSTPDGEYARLYLLPIIRDGAQKYIANVYNTELMAVKVGETIIPITVSDFHPDNTYTVSPYSHYVSYGGFEEVHRLENPPIEALIKFVMRPVAWYFRRTELDKVVYVNNWLLSTNLYPSVNSDQLSALCEALPKWFPDRAIIFRSLDRIRSPHICDHLSAHDYDLVLSRQVWFMEPAEAMKFRQFKEDLRLIKRNGHVRSEELSDDELARGVDLYNQLYLKKYSYYNPQFTVDFLRLARDEKILNLRMLRKDGVLNAIMGYFVRNGAMTQPLFGYDTSLPQETALYRHLTAVTLQEGLEKKLLVHASGGVGKFKKGRSGKRVIEYNAVFTKHLPRYRQTPWKLIQRIGELAIPVFEKNDF
jgi:hypothetical protein